MKIIFVNIIDCTNEKGDSIYIGSKSFIILKTKAIIPIKHLDKQKNNEINIIYNDNYNKVINEIRYKYNIDRVMDPNKELIENNIKI